MPNPLIKSLADKSNKSMSEIEKKWKESEEIVQKEYPDLEKNNKYYGILVKILKDKIGLTKSFKDLF